MAYSASFSVANSVTTLKNGKNQIRSEMIENKTRKLPDSGNKKPD